MKTPSWFDPEKIYQSKNFGKFSIEGYNSRKSVDIQFLDTGFKCSVHLSQIRLGDVKDYKKPISYGFGCLGCHPKDISIIKRVHQTWFDMLKRCYDEKYHAYHRYGGRGVSVCSEWSNFNKFQYWYLNECKNKGIDPECKKNQLDKDIRGEGSIYSPDSCLIVTPEENTIQASGILFSVIDPNGVKHTAFGIAKFCRENDLSPDKISQVLLGNRKHHKGWTKAD
ncbi:winged helix-turn-helix DNA-binding domain protein [Vibrio phage 1.135.O._10N.222.54.B6]|nr:winged helix-turn-helix DNA-binding domain protein [Vibrio phage 1.135.O._10N.222.54.B6]